MGIPWHQERGGTAPRACLDKEIARLVLPETTEIGPAIRQAHGALYFKEHWQDRCCNELEALFCQLFTINISILIDVFKPRG